MQNIKSQELTPERKFLSLCIAFVAVAIFRFPLTLRELPLSKGSPSGSLIVHYKKQIDDSLGVFVALCIMVIVVSLNHRIDIGTECFREYLLLVIAHLILAFFKSFCTGQDKK